MFAADASSYLRFRLSQDQAQDGVAATQTATVAISMISSMTTVVTLKLKLGQNPFTRSLGVTKTRVVLPDHLRKRPVRRRHPRHVGG